MQKVIKEWLLQNIRTSWTSQDGYIMQKDCDGVYRPDFVWELQTHIVILENDENQHKNMAYSCDTRRMVDIVNNYGGRPVVFIRFNPDHVKYRDSHKNSNPDWRRRVGILRTLLNYYLSNKAQFTGLMMIHRICYDGCDQQSLLSTAQATWESGEFKEHAMSFSL